MQRPTAGNHEEGETAEFPALNVALQNITLFALNPQIKTSHS